jgi:hypothetical protein
VSSAFSREQTCRKEVLCKLPAQFSASGWELFYLLKYKSNAKCKIFLLISINLFWVSDKDEVAIVLRLAWKFVNMRKINEGLGVPPPASKC